MALEQLEGMANNIFDVQDTIIWETATDWNNAVSEAGVVHDGFGDYPGTGTVQLGYPASGFTSNIALYYPFYENTGTTVNDVSGNANDGTVQDVVANDHHGATGLHNTDTYEFTGSGEFTSDGDYVDYPSIDIRNGYTVAFWMYPTDVSSSVEFRAYTHTNGGHANIPIRGADGQIDYQWNDGSNWYTINGPFASTNTLYSCVANYDGSTGEFWVNGSSQGTATASMTDHNEQNVVSGRYNQGVSELLFSGRIFDYQIYTSACTASEAQAYHDAGTSGTFTTATKSFSTSRTPDLTDLVYSLNGHSISVDVIGSPGTASEEIVTQSLGGASSYSLTWSNSHNDFRVSPTISTSSEFTSPTISAIGLTG